MKIVMTDLVQLEGTKKSHLITWLPYDAKVKVGTVISLKNPGPGLDGKWTVDAQMSIQDLQEIRSNRDFQGSIK